MESSSEKNNLPSSTQDKFNLSKILNNYLRHWKWFVLSCMVFIGLAILYLRYTTPEYNATAKIMLVEDSNSSSPATALLKDLKTLSEGEGKKVKDEIEVLKSRSLMEGVVKKLSLNIQYFALGRIHETELYNNPPIKINFIASDSIVHTSKFNFTITITSDSTFDFIVEEEKRLDKNITYGKNISTPLGEIVITPISENLSGYTGKSFFVKIKPVVSVAESYKNKVSISPADDYSKIINLSLNDPVKEKAQHIINTLIDEYNRVSIEDKNTKSKNAADFINERINLISEDLSNVDDEIERFKTGNRLTNITSESEMYLNTSAQTEQNLSVVRTELNMVNYMKDQIEDNSAPFSRIPSNVGLTDNSINATAQKYNDLLDNRDKLLKSSNEKNPIIVNLDEQLNNLKSSLRQSLDNSSKAIGLQIRSLENQSNRINSKIFAVPGQVRKSRDIEREQATKESLFLFLLERREEATIALTATSPNAKIIDKAYTHLGIPVFPNKKIVLIAAFILGLCIPFSTIYVKDLLDNKIHNKEDLEETVRDVTVLGEIPRLRGKDFDALIKRNDRSILSESFRIIRTNFDYVRRGRNVKKYDNVIFVTSTINNEGKSFLCMNLALTFANTDKKVLLIGADIRNPKVYPAIKEKVKNSKLGLTEYLVDKSVNISDTINTFDINNNKIDVLLSGKVPPNPAELLMSDRMEPLFDELSSNYDYVIVDTAPSMLVTDTLLFSHYAGHTIYLTRAGYTEKNILNFAKELHVNNKLKGMMLVVNDVKQSNFGYGAKYGYYGAHEKKGFFGRRKT